MSTIRKPPTGASLAALALILMTGFGVLFLLGAVAALFLQRNPLIPHIAAVRVMIGGFDLLLLLFLGWCVWTIAGIFRLRPAARISMIVLGALDFLLFSLLSGSMFFLRSTPLVAGIAANPNPAMPVPIGATLLALACFYAGFALIGLWWIVYFSLPVTRLAFEPDAAIDTANLAG